MAVTEQVAKLEAKLRGYTYFPDPPRFQLMAPDGRLRMPLNPATAEGAMMWVKLAHIELRIVELGRPGVPCGWQVWAWNESFTSRFRQGKTFADPIAAVAAAVEALAAASAAGEAK